jgi:hypothetical protein
VPTPLLYYQNSDLCQAKIHPRRLL